MSALRNDDNLSTADLVNAENTRDPQSRGFELPNRQPQQGIAVAETQVQGGAKDARSLPDLEDTTDPRTQPAGRVQGRDIQSGPETRSTMGVVQRDANDRDPRPAASEGAAASTAAVANAASRATASDSESRHDDMSSGPLFPADELQSFRTQWDRVQVSFVDEPRQAVQQADSLVANVVKRIAEQFAEERERLEKQWDRGDNVSTEDLRQGLRRYRALFDRLLSF